MWPNDQMTDNLQDFRRDRMREVIAGDPYNGNAASFAKASGRSVTQINDMLSYPPRKAFGERVARGMAEKLGKPLDFFDKQTQGADSGSQIKPESPFGARKKTKRDVMIAKIVECLHATSDQGLEFLLGTAKATVENSPIANKQTQSST